MQPVRSRRRSTDMLRELPPVFDLRDVSATFGMERGAASRYCYRWVGAGFVLPAGSKAGTYYNLVKDPTGPETRRPEAVARMLRRPVMLVGGSALHAHGWTTQRHQRTEIAAPVSWQERTVPAVNGFVVAKRPRPWFVAMRAALAAAAAAGEETVAQGFPLPPAEWALVDAISSPGVERGIWRPAADDVELPPDSDAAAALARILEACEALGADADEVLDFASRVDGLEDAADEARASGKYGR